MARRAAIVIGLLLVAAFYSTRAGSAEAVVVREPLSALPNSIGDWRGQEASPLADDVLAQLGVDDYINRQYFRPAQYLLASMSVTTHRRGRATRFIHPRTACLAQGGVLWKPGWRICERAAAPFASISS